MLWVHNSLGLPDLISYTEIVRFFVFAQSIAFRLAPILSVWVWLWLIVVPTQAAFFRDWASVSEYDGAEKTTGGGLEMRRSHAWGLDVTGTPQGAGGVGGLLFTAHHGSGSSPAVHTVCYDGNGNVTALASAATGTLTAYYDYDAFGSTLRATGPAALANSYRFSTKPVDEETGLVYYGYRWYHPELGRWLSRDPIGEAGGLNLYGMVGNDPVNGVDVLGLTLQDDWFVDQMVQSQSLAEYWGLAVAYSLWDGVSFGALGRREVLEQALEAGLISERQFYNGQAVNGMFSAAQVGLTASTAGMGSGWVAAGQGALSAAGRGALVGAGLGVGNEAFDIAAEELMKHVGGLPSDLTACEVLERLKNAGLIGGGLGGLGGGAAKALSEMDWRKLLSRFRNSDKAIEALNAARTTLTGPASAFERTHGLT